MLQNGALSRPLFSSFCAINATFIAAQAHLIQAGSLGRAGSRFEAAARVLLAKTKRYAGKLRTPIVVLVGWMFANMGYSRPHETVAVHCAETRPGWRRRHCSMHKDRKRADLVLLFTDVRRVRCLVAAVK